MKRMCLLTFMLMPSAAFAQQQPSDPALAVCQQLLTGANANLIQVAAQAQTINKQLEAAQAELAKLKQQPPPEANKSKD